VDADLAAAPKALACKYSRRVGDNTHGKHPLLLEDSRVDTQICAMPEADANSVHVQPVCRRRCASVCVDLLVNRHTIWLLTSAQLEEPKLRSALSNDGPTDARISAKPTAAIYCAGSTPVSCASRSDKLTLASKHSPAAPIVGQRSTGYRDVYPVI